MAVKFDKSKLVKNLASGNILAPFLDKVLNTFDEEWEFQYQPKEHDTAWHPSGDCLPSVTTLYENAVTTEYEPKSGSILKSFMVGQFWHQYLQHIILHELEFCEPDAIERVGFEGWGERWMVRETPENCHKIWQPYHWMRGSGDIAPLETPKWRGVVDIKTMSSHQFRQSVLPEWAKDKYLCQLQMYMHLFNEERGMILAVNKDAPHDFKELHFTRNQPLIDAILRKWKFVSECVSEGKPPTAKDNEEYELPT